MITPDEVIKQSSSDEKIDPRKLQTAIEIAEERFVRTALGYDLYDTLASQKNVLITSDNQSAIQGYLDMSYGAGQVTAVIGAYANSMDIMPTASQLLWTERLWKYTAECVRFVVMPEVYANLSSQGIMKNHPMVSAMGSSGSEAASVSLADVKWLMDKWMGDRIETLENALHQYIARHLSDFPGYVRADECRRAQEVDRSEENTRKVGWITGIYDDEDKRCCEW